MDRLETLKEWVSKQPQSYLDSLVFQVPDDAMEPTLTYGDLLLLEAVNSPTQARDGICVFKIDESIMVKRLQFDFGTRRYKVINDNPAYDPFYIGEEFEGRFQILGRMVRVLQRAKR